MAFGFASARDTLGRRDSWEIGICIRNWKLPLRPVNVYIKPTESSRERIRVIWQRSQCYGARRGCDEIMGWNESVMEYRLGMLQQVEGSSRLGIVGVGGTKVLREALKSSVIRLNRRSERDARRKCRSVRES